MQQAKKSAAITEAESDGIFRFVIKRRVVELEFAERIAQRFVIVGEYRKQPREDHGLGGFEAGKRRRVAAGFDDRVAHAGVGDALDVGDDEADVAGFEFFESDGLGSERAELLDFVDIVAGAEANLHVIGDAAFHHTNQHHRAAVGVKPGIENQGLQRILRAALGSGNAMNDRFEHVFDAQAALGADGQRVVRGNGEDAFDLLFDEVNLRGGQVNFVDDRQDGEIAGGGEKSVGDGLRFDALRSVDDEQSAFAGREGAGNFIGEIDVAGRVDQIQPVSVAVFGVVVQANAFGLDGDAAFAFEVHGIENLRVHFALREAAGHFDQTIGKSGFAVIDVRDDAEISLELWVHVPVWPAAAERKKAA